MHRHLGHCRRFTQNAEHSLQHSPSHSPSCSPKSMPARQFWSKRYLAVLLKESSLILCLPHYLQTITLYMRSNLTTCARFAKRTKVGRWAYPDSIITVTVPASRPRTVAEFMQTESQARLSSYFLCLCVHAVTSSTCCRGMCDWAAGGSDSKLNRGAARWTDNDMERTRTSVKPNPATVTARARARAGSRSERWRDRCKMITDKAYRPDGGCVRCDCVFSGPNVSGCVCVCVRLRLRSPDVDGTHMLRILRFSIFANAYVCVCVCVCVRPKQIACPHECARWLLFAVRQIGSDDDWNVTELRLWLWPGAAANRI